MSDVKCPYCAADVEINHDDGYGYEEDETHQQKCPYCKKTFIYTTAFHFSYGVSKADCLNGAPHEWKDVPGCRCDAWKVVRCPTCQWERRVVL